MRTWYVRLEALDDNRLVAQHRELHSVYGSILSPVRGYQGHPVTKLYNGPHLACALDYHDVTVTEMERRGWYGHKTPLSDEIRARASELTSDVTCGSWYTGHVQKAVPKVGPYSVDADIHDLIDRWTNENKKLRNQLASEYVFAHSQICKDACCVTYAESLVAEYTDRANQEREGKRFDVKGNASLRGQPDKLEHLLAKA